MYSITTPIYYVNADPHIGHYYSTLLADVIARWQRVKGKRVFFQTGTDEHGQKIEQAAKSKDKTPLELATEVSNSFKKTFLMAGFTFDRFIRTTEPKHKLLVQKLWTKLSKDDHIYLGKYSGHYNISDECFVAKGQVEERLDGYYCQTTGVKLIWQEEDNYLFRLSKFQSKLLQHYEENPNWIIPNSRQNEIIKFIQDGLEDLSISRSNCEWGIPVPDEAKKTNSTIYVWLDALTNYISGSWKDDSELFYNPDVWPAEVHVVGKDILKFHAIYWPAFLMAADIPLPKRIIAHGWWTKDGEKISKSTGNVFDPIQKSVEYSSDALRYYLLREASFGHDGDFVETRLQSKLNCDLADKLGNLVCRATGKRLLPDGTIQRKPSKEEYSESDKSLINEISKLVVHVDSCLTHQFDIQSAVISIWETIGTLNQYFAQQAPWRLKTQDVKRYQTIMYIILESVRILSILIEPIIPVAAARIQNIYQPILENPFDWGKLEEGIMLNIPENFVLFTKIA